MVGNTENVAYHILYDINSCLSIYTFLISLFYFTVLIDRLITSVSEGVTEKL